MVLAALADLIYNVYLFLYYIFKTTSFIGFLVYDTTSNAVRILLWCFHNINVFIKIVYEDNQQIIQDSKTVLLGTADFFINNITKVFRAVCFTVATFRDAILTVWSLLGLTLWSIKRALILTGQAIWLLFTAPYQLLVLLEQQIKRESYLLIETAQKTYSKCVEAVSDFALFVAHDVPVEAACGLGLLVLTCFYPSPAKIALQLISKTVHHHGNHIAERQPDRQEANPEERPLFHLSLQRTFTLLRSFVTFNTLQREGQNAQPPVRPPARRTPSTTIGSCIICEDNDRAVAFVPCGHLCVCKTCAAHIIYNNPVCPLCRTYIEKKLQIYI
uniref:RING-type domain-containing protein n=1 Tax=Anopheles farauti TaxID=69004 RepID=A0A182QKG6_9DIPT